MARTAELVGRLEGIARIRHGGNRAQLVTAALVAGEGQLTNSGALSVSTGSHTGRSPKDKFIVRDALTGPHVWWDSAVAMSPESFELLLGDMLDYARGRDLYREDLSAGAGEDFRMAVDVFTETAWHALFIRNLLRPAVGEAAMSALILQLPGFTADPKRHGTRSGTVIALDMSRNIVLIGGTAYAGEIKKSVFSLINFHAPLHGIFPMHCSANIGSDSTALFFGLSGTGKTTLSSDAARPLIGDDEHLWSDTGIANIEGGCYAKTARLSPAAEPEIHAAAQSFSTVLENVVLVDGEPDYDDLSLTENTRAAYPLAALSATAAAGTGPTPATVIFLTADAFGVFAESFARFMGTAQFLLYMTAFVALWILWNTLGPDGLKWDPAPSFIMLTLLLSLQASYAAPLILLAQNRQEARDRVVAEQDRQADARAHADMEFLAREVASLRMAVGEVATRDFLRSELRALLSELDERTQDGQREGVELHPAEGETEGSTT